MNEDSPGDKLVVAITAIDGRFDNDASINTIKVSKTAIHLKSFNIVQINIVEILTRLPFCSLGIYHGGFVYDYLSKLLKIFATFQPTVNNNTFSI